MEPDQLSLKAEAQFHKDPPCGHWHFSTGHNYVWGCKCLLIPSAVKSNINWNYCTDPIKWLTVTLLHFFRCTRLPLSRRLEGSLPPEVATSKPLSGSSPSPSIHHHHHHPSPSIIIIQAIVRFITINSSLSSPYCSSTPHILRPKQKHKLPGLPKLQTMFKL